jgi:hypothetical protein
MSQLQEDWVGMGHRRGPAEQAQRREQGDSSHVHQLQPCQKESGKIKTNGRKLQEISKTFQFAPPICCCSVNAKSCQKSFKKF